MRILLVEPPFERLMGFYRDYFPISLAYLAGALETAGFEVLIYDAEHSQSAIYLGYKARAKRYDAFLQALEDEDHEIWQEASRVFTDFKPDIIGFSVMTVKFAAALKMAALAKAVLPDSVIVFGGPHPTIMPEQVLEHDEVDYVIRGEGESSIVDFCHELQDRRDPVDIKGLSWRRGGKTINNPDCELIEDISSIAHPARHLLSGIETYNPSDLGLMMTSRGCPFQCTYCSSQCMWHRKVRYRSNKDVVDEIEAIIGRFGVSYLTLEDDSFTVNKKRVLEFCEELERRRIKIGWSVITRIDLLDDQMLKVMKKAGCDHVRVGVESGSDRVLTAIKKGITTDDVRAGARLLKRHGLYWSAYFMIGLPYETEEDINSTIALMKEIAPSYSTLSVFTPYPGTELFDYAVEAGLADHDMDWSKSSHHSPYNYYTPNIDRARFEQLLTAAEEAFDRQNRRPGALVAKLKTRLRVYLHDPAQIAADGRKFLYWSGILKASNE